MTDEQNLELSQKLALAFGWIDAATSKRNNSMLVEDGCVICWDVQFQCWRIFDYRDPVIAMAAINRFNLNIFTDSKNVWLRHRALLGHSFKHCPIELAIASCIIEAHKKWFLNVPQTQ